MIRIEEVVELFMVVAHRSRVAFDEICAFEEFVPQEVLLLRALHRRGAKTTGRDLARALGWSPGRVSQVVDGLVEKEFVVRTPRLSITGAGLSEADQGAHVLRTVAEKIVESLDEDELYALFEMLRRVAANSEGLWRIRRNACE
jgi:DNA-binding MarR family transcriptional regulator